ncbi:MAG TPA: COX15/CtaA family protein [Patescibacteria group bacterium]|nr:COX15/CtaA family protein [Patescibacteria group bacterium]
MAPKDKKLIGAWLIIGVIMVFIQVLIGGITRLTGSGLSITRWEVVTGTIPPLDETAWQAEFNLYKQSPQFKKINHQMTLPEFKGIYFWEYFHRLWARTLGFVFLIPFAWFVFKKKIRGALLKKAVIAFLLGGLVGIFGWIMVASGLSDRPMVSPYKLAIHLSLAIITLGYLLWVALDLLVLKEKAVDASLKKSALWLTGLVSFQIVLGAIVSGMRAAFFFPTWPDMNGTFIPDILLQTEFWSWNAFIHFEKFGLAPALFQFLHRNTAYIIAIWTAVLIFKSFKNYPAFKNLFLVLGGLILTQVALGIFTLIGSIGTIPVALGVAHQGVGILTLMWLLVLNYKFSGEKAVFKTAPEIAFKREKLSVANRF